jgi:hypothetical protein
VSGGLPCGGVGYCWGRWWSDKTFDLCRCTRRTRGLHWRAIIPPGCCAMRRRWLLLGLAGMLALPGFAGMLTLLQPTPEPGVSRENVLRLREGMTRERVESILGQPTAIVRGGTRHWERSGSDGPFVIEIVFDDSDCLGYGWTITNQGFDTFPSESSFLHRLRQKLRHPLRW